MGYAVYEDPYSYGRWAGYGVPAECDVADCHTRIDRGMGYRCETYYAEEEVLDADGEVVDLTEVEEEGCYLHFCEKHEDHVSNNHDKVEPKPYVAPSWQKWREDNPHIVKTIAAEIEAADPEVLAKIVESQKDELEDDE
jgi:hypothetical protein